MENNSLRYVQRQKLTGRSLILKKTHDSSGKKFPERNIVASMQKYIQDFIENPRESKRWIVMPGLRGVGKTTVMAQTYLMIDKQMGNRANLIYVSLDEVVAKINSNLDQIIEAYESILGITLELLEKPTFIFIDEVQADPQWARVLKFIYDRTDKVFFMCTGSSATHLQMDADIAGRRAQIEKLYPLNFSEYQLLFNNIYPERDLKKKLITATYCSKSANEAYQSLASLLPAVNRQWAQYDRKNIDTYITTGTMPLGLHSSEHDIYASIRAMVDKVISSDLQSLRHFSADSVSAMGRLLFILAGSGDLMTINSLSKWINISRPHVNNMLDALVKTELIVKIPAHGNNLTATRNPPKYRFMSSAIRAAHYDIVGDPNTQAVRRGMLLEDIGALHFYREFVTRNICSVTHYYDKHGGHCDFILNIGNSYRLAVEMSLGNKNTTQIEKTMGKVDCKYGIVFSDSELAVNSSQTILFVPLDFFFLM